MCVCEHFDTKNCFAALTCLPYVHTFVFLYTHTHTHTRTHVVHMILSHSLILFPYTLSCLRSLMNARTHVRTHIQAHPNAHTHTHVTDCLAYMVGVLSLSWYSSTCHERTPSGPGKSVRTLQVAAHQRDGLAGGGRQI